MDMMNFDIDQLQIADILLFSGEEDRTSQAIMWLTNSKVTHAALYRGQGEIIEETSPNVKIYKLNSDGRFHGREMYINRLNKKQFYTEPVINAATTYLNNITPYAYSNLYLLGLILLYKKFSPNFLTKRVMIKIYKKLAAYIIEFINQHKSPGKLPMVCSQFVFQCYEDAGEDYHLKLGKASLRESLLVNKNNLTMVEQVISYVQLSSLAIEAPNWTDVDLEIQSILSQTEEELAQELLEALQSNEVATTDEIDDELAVAVHKFGEAAYLAESKAENSRPVMLEKSNELARDLKISPGLSFLKIKEAYFVTPEDLLNNCDNLVQVGVIKM